MKVRCIDASECGETLTVGKVYEVTAFEAHGELRYWVIDDTGEQAVRYQTRFEPIPDEPEAPAEQPRCPKCSSDNISHDADNVEHCMGCGWPADKALAELPKVDKYEEHRLNSVSELTLRELTDAKQPGATARLLRGLEGEKLRERVRSFPAVGRNFELKGKR